MYVMSELASPLMVCFEAHRERRNNIPKFILVYDLMAEYSVKSVEKNSMIINSYTSFLWITQKDLLRTLNITPPFNTVISHHSAKFCSVIINLLCSNIKLFGI